jgi:alkanesulfonate monooxygenase SsuD/methylene tetrahydromethanopterin reductase-like flavin-dependent oxidoreductase (luciferase family)
VPIEIGLGTNLIGTDELVVERLRRYRDAGVNQLRVSVVGHGNTARLDQLGRLIDLVQIVNREINGVSDPGL